jgi:hypothetical protein
MKTCVLSLGIVFCSMVSAAQSSTGLIAHWDMNGSVNDVTGNGHNGTPYNLLPAVGRDGSTGSAMYFNGTNSYIDVPYKADLNLDSFSICATIKVISFYPGQCQANFILNRGTQFYSGNYGLMYYDNAYDNDNCSALDTTQETFSPLIGNNGYSGPSLYYTPTIANNTWYSVVETFDGTNVTVYVNGVLKTSVALTGAPIGTSAEGLSIGANRSGQFGQYPYNVHGIIDDVKLYGRALTQADAIAYTASTLGIASNNHEISSSIYPNPASSELHLDLTAASTDFSYAICNELGQQLLTGRVNSSHSILDISQLATGFYYLRLNSGTKSLTSRFVKQ